MSKTIAYVALIIAFSQELPSLTGNAQNGKG